jgi:hypothetical protein
MKQSPTYQKKELWFLNRSTPKVLLAQRPETTMPQTEPKETQSGLGLAYGYLAKNCFWILLLPA